jgi:hypothetical protein
MSKYHSNIDTLNYHVYNIDISLLSCFSLNIFFLSTLPGDPILIPLLSLTRKVQLTAGIYAAKALEQHLCRRFHVPKNAHVIIPGD